MPPRQEHLCAYMRRHPPRNFTPSQILNSPPPHPRRLAKDVWRTDRSSHRCYVAESPQGLRSMARPSTAHHTKVGNQSLHRALMMRGRVAAAEHRRGAAAATRARHPPSCAPPECHSRRRLRTSGRPVAATARSACCTSVNYRKMQLQRCCTVPAAVMGPPGPRRGPSLTFVKACRLYLPNLPYS